MLTQHDREEWWRHPMTQEFVRQLTATREKAKEDWACHCFIDRNSRENSDRHNLYALAGIEMLDKILDLVEENRPQPMKSED